MLPRIAVVALLLVCACRSRITGNQGNLEFSYVTDDDVFDFNKPIGVGAKLKLKVARAGTRGAVTLTKVTSSLPTVIEVDSFSGNQIILKGVGRGSALISVEATAEGMTLPDDVNMTARVPEVLQLAHTCVIGSEGRYLVDKNIFVPFELMMKNNQNVIGYGLYPVTVSPDAGLVLDTASTDQAFMHFRTAAAPLTATVSSTIDATTATFVLVQPSDITGGEHWVPPLPTLVNTTGFYHVVPTVAGKRVCQPDLTTTVTNLSPNVCDVAMVNGAPNEPKGRFGWVAVTGKVVGNCDFTITYPQGNAGAGASASLRVAIAAFVLPDGGQPIGADGGQSDAGRPDGG